MKHSCCQTVRSRHYFSSICFIQSAFFLDAQIKQKQLRHEGNGLPVLQETNRKQLSWKQMDLSFLHYSKAGNQPSCSSDKLLLLCHLFLGSLLNLAKHPASTVQLLGAEKALFRALKTKRDTPKFGLIYHASLVGQSNTKNKGKVSCIVLYWLGFFQGINSFSFMMAWASQWGFSMAWFTVFLLMTWKMPLSYQALKIVHSSSKKGNRIVWHTWAITGVF